MYQLKFLWYGYVILFSGTESESVAAFKEPYRFQLFLHAFLLVVRHVLERHTIRPQIESQEFHDAFSADDISPKVTDDIDDLL